MIFISGLSRCITSHYDYALQGEMFYVLYDKNTLWQLRIGRYRSPRLASDDEEEQMFEIYFFKLHLTKLIA